MSFSKINGKVTKKWDMFGGLLELRLRQMT